MCKNRRWADLHYLIVHDQLRTKLRLLFPVSTVALTSQLTLATL